MRSDLPVWAGVTGCLLFCLLLGPGASGAPAQGLTIELTGVPERLSFPIPPGQNPVLTARIRGGAARDVWLGEQRSSRLRLQLDRASESTYQINLGDPEVWIALGRKAAGGFRIFATDAKGDVARSIAVRYGPMRRIKARLRPVVVVEGKKRNLSPVYLWRPNWVDPAKVDRLEVRIEGDRVAATAEARIGDAGFPFFTDAKSGHLVFVVTPAVRAEWRKAGTLSIFHQLPGKDPEKVEVRAAPDRLDLPPGGLMFTVMQRDERALAGSGPRVKMLFASVSIGDITAGQVRMTLRLGNHRVISGRSLRGGERLHFRLGGHRYTILIARLVNFLIGDDYAILVAYEGRLSEKVKINTLIRMMRHMPVSYLRGEKKLGRGELEKALSDFRAGWKPEEATLSAFIDAAARAPACEGVTVRVFQQDQQPTLHAWLTEHAAVFKEPAKKPDAVAPAPTKQSGT